MSDMKVEALHQAVVARKEDDTPEDLVARAEAFHSFLVPDRPPRPVAA